MSDIFDEVLQDQKKEKLIVLFFNVLPLIIILTLISAIFIGIYSYKQYCTKCENQKIGDVFVDLIANYKDSKKEYIDNLVKENNNHRLIELLKIKKAIECEDVNITLQQLEMIIENLGNHEITNAFARILWLNLIIDQDNISEKITVKALNYMKYFKEPRQIFFVNATLLKAVFYKKNGQSDIAAAYAREILNMTNVSSILKQQAYAVLLGL